MTASVAAFGALVVNTRAKASCSLDTRCGSFSIPRSRPFSFDIPPFGGFCLPYLPARPSASAAAAAFQLGARLEAFALDFLP